MVRLKVKQAFSEKSGDRIFQFLMVRLKAPSVIKATPLLSLFQFLMVRLKDLQTHIRQFARIHFNSLWCD
mgnify:CR=1 FL=1